MFEPRKGLPFWETAYREHGPRLMAFLSSRVRRREDAEDLFQETFVRVIKAREELDDRSKTQSYLFTTAHNLVISHMRRLRVRVDNVEADEMLKAAERWAAGQGADSSLEMRELRERLTEALANMTKSERRAFELGVLQKEPYEDIASKLGWSRGQVKINVFRARKRAMDSLGEWFDTSGEKESSR